MITFIHIYIFDLNIPEDGAEGDFFTVISIDSLLSVLKKIRYYNTPNQSSKFRTNN